MKTLNDEEFLEKLKSFVLWQVFKKTKGEFVNFAPFELNKNQSHMFCRVCAELAMRHLGSPTTSEDGVREIIDEIIRQEEQLINGAE